MTRQMLFIDTVVILQCVPTPYFVTHNIKKMCALRLRLKKINKKFWFIKDTLKWNWPFCFVFLQVCGLEELTMTVGVHATALVCAFVPSEKNSLAQQKVNI